MRPNNLSFKTVIHVFKTIILMHVDDQVQHCVYSCFIRVSQSEVKSDNFV
jgi:hypothetical protein